MTDSKTSEYSLEDFQKKIAQDADTAVRLDMPRRILKLHKLIEDNEELRTIVPLKVTTFEEKTEKDEAQTSKKRKVEEGSATSTTEERNTVPLAERKVIPCNKRVMDLMAVVKAEVLESVRIMGTIKTWIQLSIPKLESGNNFDAAVKEECSAELGRVEESGFTILDAMTKYFQTRARLVHKMTKHPKVLDYRQAVIECDEGEYSNMRMCLVDIRDSMTMMHDLLTKNLDRIRKERPEQLSMLY